MTCSMAHQGIDVVVSPKEYFISRDTPTVFQGSHPHQLHVLYVTSWTYLLSLRQYKIDLQDSLQDYKSSSNLYPNLILRTAL